MYKYACMLGGCGNAIEYQSIELWPTRTLYYRRHMVETNLLATECQRPISATCMVRVSDRYERCCYVYMYAHDAQSYYASSHFHTHTRTAHELRSIGNWQRHNDDGSVKKVIGFECDVDNKRQYRGLLQDARVVRLTGPMEFMKTVSHLLGVSDSKRILRWRSSTRHPLFDDDQPCGVETLQHVQ